MRSNENFQIDKDSWKNISINFEVGDNNLQSFR